MKEDRLAGPSEVAAGVDETRLGRLLRGLLQAAVREVGRPERAMGHQELRDVVVWTCLVFPAVTRRCSGEASALVEQLQRRSKAESWWAFEWVDALPLYAACAALCGWGGKALIANVDHGNSEIRHRVMTQLALVAPLMDATDEWAERAFNSFRSHHMGAFDCVLPLFVARAPIATRAHWMDHLLTWQVDEEVMSAMRGGALLNPLATEVGHSLSRAALVWMRAWPDADPIARRRPARAQQLWLPGHAERILGVRQREAAAALGLNALLYEKLTVEEFFRV